MFTFPMEWGYKFPKTTSSQSLVNLKGVNRANMAKEWKNRSVKISTSNIMPDGVLPKWKSYAFSKVGIIFSFSLIPRDRHCSVVLTMISKIYLRMMYFISVHKMLVIKRKAVCRAAYNFIKVREFCEKKLPRSTGHHEGFAFCGEKLPWLNQVSCFI